MISRRVKLTALIAIAFGAFAPASSASAAAPQWQLTLSAFPHSFIAGAEGNLTEGPGYQVVAKNGGTAPTSGPYSVVITLSEEISPGAEITGKDQKGNPLSCEASGQTVKCTGAEAIAPGEKVEVKLAVNVAADVSGGVAQAEALLEGGGAETVKAKAETGLGAPAWRLHLVSLPTAFTPGLENHPRYLIVAENVGAAATVGPITIKDTLPGGLTPTSHQQSGCSAAGQTVTCTSANTVEPGLNLIFQVSVEVDPLLSVDVTDEASIEGGGAPPVAVKTITPIGEAARFDLLSGDTGFSTPLGGPDGSPVTQAGAHPYQLTIDFSFSNQRADGLIASVGGGVRDVFVDLPRGMIVDPNGTPVRCTEDRLQSETSPDPNGGCPDASQIGTATALTPFQEGAIPWTSPLYNMVAPPGAPSSFGFNIGGIGLFFHITGALRSGDDYGLSGNTRDLLSLGNFPVLGATIEFWGDPSNPSHDAVRGRCLSRGSGLCPTTPSQRPVVTNPVECPDSPTISRIRADDWEEPGVFHEASYESADLEGNRVVADGCNQLEFKPSIEARPTTNLADSPSGLDVDVHQPQSLDLDHVSPAIMRNLSLTLPQGMTVNPSSADGLGACSQAEAHVHSLAPASCPAASKLGSVEVRTPLQDHPLEGALYLAEPYENPFGSLLALYLAVHDPLTGVVTNLAGRVIPDPSTGQLSTIFEDNPQLPIEDVKAHLFTGPRASLRTPPACATYTSTAEMVPWSAPETPNAHPTDSFAITASPNGGSCPSSTDQLPQSPSFTAGTIAPQAGAYSPFVLKLTRPDGTAEAQKIEATLAPGQVAKLSGIPYCPEADIAKAYSRSKPNEGALEQADPSCPASSEVGEVQVAAGAGITPLHVGGNAYLAGPYKGAPLSLVVITPAVAGPFDLGAVVVRTALALDPETAQVKAVSDPLPRILQGIPLDVRQIYLKMGRPDFTLNPTSCDPFAVNGALTSTLGQSTPLSSPFQVGGCSALAYKPKLALRLKGATKRTGHPALTAVASFRPGDANTKRVQVTLPKSEFLDQAHIGTVCTRVQFAADQCPAASVYGKARATTPLLDQPLEGPVYLRSSSHELPDLVIALQGQVDVVLAGRVDSVGGGIRTTFEATPDAPVTQFTLQMRGGRKGLLVNSANLCRLSLKQTRATVQMDGQNGKARDSFPALKSSCKKAKKPRAHKKHAK
jgi:hypothetical protein